MADILRSDQGGICTLTLNRPEKLNSLTVGLFAALLSEIEKLEGESEQIGCVVLRGAGRCFSAGHDLADLAVEEKLPNPHFQAQVIERLQNLPMPVIGVVHSYCYTGALELVLAADLIVATEDAQFADTHAKWGLTPIWGLSQRLPRRVGINKAREMMYTCRSYSATEALGMSLINKIVANDMLEVELETLTAIIINQSWHSHRAAKRLLHQTDGLSIDQGLAHEIYHGVGFGPDYRDRIKAFLDKKKH